jgi:hypothetical protein
MDFAVWRALAGVLTGAICCQRARENFAAGNAFVSGDWRSSRWCNVEVSWQRLWCKSVMSVREKCDEKDRRQPSAISLQVLQLGVGGLAGHPSAIAQGRLSRKAREVAHPQLFRSMLQRQTRVVLPR